MGVLHMSYRCAKCGYERSRGNDYTPHSARLCAAIVLYKEIQAAKLLIEIDVLSPLHQYLDRAGVPFQVLEVARPGATNDGQVRKAKFAPAWAAMLGKAVFELPLQDELRRRAVAFIRRAVYIDQTIVAAIETVMAVLRQQHGAETTGYTRDLLSWVSDAAREW